MMKSESGRAIDLPTAMDIPALQLFVDALEKNSSLIEEKNYDLRSEAIDSIEFEIIDRIEVLQQNKPQPNALLQLKYRAEKLKLQLEEIDCKIFQRIRAGIQAGKYKPEEFKSLVNEYVCFNPNDNKSLTEPSYDNFDIFINGIFSFPDIPRPTKALEPDMIFYQKTPAKIVFELVEKSGYTKDDVFFDLGAGPGQTTILVNLLTGMRTNGVEYEPAFCRCANDCATDLHLSNINFTNVDARKANYGEGTIFFLFTPFIGKMLEEVSCTLKKESTQRKIKLITYGPCSRYISSLSWLKSIVPFDGNDYALSVFTSL